MLGLSSGSMEPLSAKVARITGELGLPKSLSIAQAIKQANDQLGLDAGGTSLVQQANTILEELGLGSEVPVVDAVAVDAEPAVPVATGKVADSPPEHSSGTGTPSPTKGTMPAVPMRYRARTKRKLTGFDVWLCGWNIACVVALLFVVWFHVIVEHNVTGTFVPPPPPPSPPQAPTSCPFDVVACNRKCALMHVDCQEGGGIFNATPTHQRRLAGKKKKKKKKRANCDALHGRETAKGSTAAFTNFTDQRAHLESLDWAHEPLLWGLRKENIGDGTCDRSGCAATLCECNYEGGDCVRMEEDDIYTKVPFLKVMPLLLALSTFVYLCTMLLLLRNVSGYLKKAPRLRDERELTAYVTKMQQAQPQVSFSVVCSHMGGGGRDKVGPGSSKSRPVFTHRSSHPFTYATSTDASTLTRNWQQPGGEDGSLGTGFVAAVSSGLSWSMAKGATADKIKAEKRRLHEENKHRDKECSVTVKVSLPGQCSDQLYVPDDAKLGKLPAVVELLLVFLGLGGPLWFYYSSRVSRHIEHKVHKTIYIEGHAAPAGGTV